MRPLLIVLALVVLSGCSLVPNSIVRVALPQGDAQALEVWKRVETALKSKQGAPSVELVSPNAFPPPDLVWFDGNFDNPEYLTQALAPNREVEELGTAAGLSSAWFTLAGDRLLPLAWNPWSWWTVEGTTPPEPSEVDQRALKALVDRQGGPALDGGESPKVITRPGTDRVWLSWATVQASPARTGLRAIPSEVVVTRVKGLWWNAKGWNPLKVPALLAALWSPEVQVLWKENPNWLPAARSSAALTPRTIVVVP